LSYKWGDLIVVYSDREAQEHKEIAANIMLVSLLWLTSKAVDAAERRARRFPPVVGRPSDAVTKGSDGREGR